MSVEHRDPRFPGEHSDGIDLRWLLLLVPVFLSFFFLPRVFLELRGVERSSMTRVVSSADQIQGVTLNGQSWSPQGQAAYIPGTQMRFAGRSREGYSVYARVAEGGGGGPAMDRRLYLRLADGRYQPLGSRD